MRVCEIDFFKKTDTSFVGEVITCHSKESSPFYVRYYSNFNDVFAVMKKTPFYDANSILGCTLHIHPYNELVLFLKPNMIMNVNGNIYTAKRGDIMVTRSGEPHFCTPLDESGVEYIQIDIPDGAFEGVSHNDIFTNCFNNRGFCEDNLLSPAEHDCDTIMKIVRRLITLLNTGEHNQMLIYSQLIQFMNAVNDVFEKKSVFSPDKALPKSIYEAVQYIHANLNTISSLKEIAEHLNLTVPYFSRMFKRCMNCTPHDYIITQRIERAKRLMCIKDLNVYEACFEAGFNDYSGFINVFRKKVGVTPLVYKKRYS